MTRRDLLDRDEDAVAAGERELEVVAVLPDPAAAEHLLVARDAVVDVDDEVAGRQPLEDVARDDPAERLRAADADGPEQLAIRDERDAVRAAGEPAVEAPADERDRAGRWRLGDPIDDGDGVPGLAEQVGEARRLVRGEDDAGAVRAPALDRVDDAGRAAERQQRARASRRGRPTRGRPGPSRRPRAAPTPRSARASAT